VAKKGNKTKFDGPTTGHSVLAHRSKYTYYENTFLMHFKNKKIEQKIRGMHMNILCPSIKVLVRKDIFCGMCKNDKKNSYVNSNFVV
jgi:hypothetical protein